MAGGSTGDADRYLVPGLRRGLEILEIFNTDRAVMSLSEIARAIFLSPSSTYRLVRTLESMGYLQAVPGTKSYRLGPRVLRLGFRYLNTDEVVDAARLHLEGLRDATGASTHLGVMDGAEVLYLLRVASRGAIASNIRIGSRVPAHATAMGRVLLSWLDAAALDALFESQDLLPYTERTITSVAELRRTLAEDRARGYVITRSSYQKGIFGVAAPLRNTQGEVVAAINASGLEDLFQDGQIGGSVRERVVETADRISESLGYSPGRRIAL